MFGDGGERQENYEHNCLDNRILAMYKFVQKPWYSLVVKGNFMQPNNMKLNQ